MKNFISGQIRTIDEANRIVSVFHKNRIKYLYIQRSLYNKIEKYLEISRFVQFVVTDEIRLYRRYKVYTVDYVIKIQEIRYRKNIVYYDLKHIKTGTQKLVNRMEYKMFLDLEMSMHPYKVDKSFIQEIIQVGYVLIDDNGNVVEEYDQTIQPTKFKKLSKRTTKFLEITQEDVDNGIPFQEFYEHFRHIIQTYNPAIIVWGRNDFLALKQAYKLNKLPTLRKKTRYVNLLKLHKNYFNLKNDLGLFNALRLYEDHEHEQSHNAFEDAKATVLIFKGFRDVVNHRRVVDISNYK